MSFCYNLQLKFWDAAQEMRLLKRDSKWSKAGYTYILASQLLMARELGQKEVDKKEIDDLLAQVHYSHHQNFCLTMRFRN